MEKSIDSAEQPPHPGNSILEFLRLMKSWHWQAPGSKELISIRAFLHGYYQGLFQNKIKEVSFPKYRWFDTWIKGRVAFEEPLNGGWPAYITRACDSIDVVESFFQYYEEFARSEVQCSFQSLTPEKKSLRNTQSGLTWENIQDLTSELLLFQLPPSKAAWCLLLTERKHIYLTIDAESREALIDKIKKTYFSIDDHWTYFDGSLFQPFLLEPISYKMGSIPHLESVKHFDTD